MCALVTGVQTCALPICLAHDPLELGPSLGLAQRRGARLPSPARSAPSDAHISPPQYPFPTGGRPPCLHEAGQRQDALLLKHQGCPGSVAKIGGSQRRSEEHTSELQSLMRISYAVFCLKKKNKKTNINSTNTTDPINIQHSQLILDINQHTTL